MANWIGKNRNDLWRPVLCPEIRVVHECRYPAIITLTFTGGYPDTPDRCNLEMCLKDSLKRGDTGGIGGIRHGQLVCHLCPGSIAFPVQGFINRGQRVDSDRAPRIGAIKPPDGEKNKVLHFNNPGISSW